MKSLIRFAIVVAVSLLAAPVARGSELWLHVRVVESGARPTTVKINVPYSLVERAAPLIEKSRIDDGNVQWNGDQVDVGDMREIWASLRAGGAKVTRDEATWELELEGAREVLVVRESGDSKGAVVRIPAALVDALLAKRDQLDLEEAARVIGKLGSGELLVVDEDGTRVRIWVDTTPEAE